MTDGAPQAVNSFAIDLVVQSLDDLSRTGHQRFRSLGISSSISVSSSILSRTPSKSLKVLGSPVYPCSYTVVRKRGTVQHLHKTLLGAWFPAFAYSKKSIKFSGFLSVGRIMLWSNTFAGLRIRE
jgi:hypothetical protein